MVSMALLKLPLLAAEDKNESFTGQGSAETGDDPDEDLDADQQNDGGKIEHSSTQTKRWYDPTQGQDDRVDDAVEKARHIPERMTRGDRYPRQDHPRQHGIEVDLQDEDDYADEVHESVVDVVELVCPQRSEAALLIPAQCHSWWKHQDQPVADLPHGAIQCVDEP